MLEEVLSREGYGVLRAYSGTEALLVLKTRRPDLILLDLMLPGLSGEELLPRLKGIPIIIISAKVDIENKINLLLEGAADYLSKPFDVRELLARIVVQLRRNTRMDSPILTFQDIVLDTGSFAVTVQKAPVHLTKTEYAILKLLMQRPSQVITKSLLLEQIGMETPDCMEGSLKVHISNLRRKLREAGGKDYIEAVWGIGFKMREES